MTRIPFVGATYALQSIRADLQRCINYYPEVIESGEGANAERGVMFQVPGLRRLITVGNGPIRAIFPTSTNRLAVVSGNQLFRVNPDYTSDFIGTLNTNGGFVEMADSGTQLMVVDGLNGYVVDLTTGVFTKINSAGFIGANRVSFLDGYFVIDNPGTDQFQISENTYDALNWSILDTQPTEGMADRSVAIVVNQRQVWAFGTKSVEVYWNSGNEIFPISRVDGSLMEFGCGAVGTPQKFSGTVAWLSDNGQVLMAEGYRPKRISNFAVEQAIHNSMIAGGSDGYSAARSYTYKQGGHLFYCLQLPNTDTTWVYDLATQQWHERCELIGGQIKASRVSCSAEMYGLTIMGDSTDGRIYTPDPDTFTNDGDVLIRRRITPHVTNNLKRLQIHKFQLDLETGLGLATGQGVNPQVCLRVSRDAGYTWGNERWTTSGAIGGYRDRAIFRQLGTARDWVFEVTITDPIRVTMLGADIDASLSVS